MFGLPNPYVLLGLALAVVASCGVSYYKGREACRVEVAEEQRKIFEKVLEERQKAHEKEMKQASVTNEVIKTVTLEGKERITYVEKLVKEQPAPSSCLLTGERLRILSEVSDATSRTSDTP